MSVRRLAACFLVFAICAAGCEKEPEYYPVQGKLTINKVPLLAVNVQFVPDPEKGNTSPEEARGWVDRETGVYTLKTTKAGDKLQKDTKVGCRPGWYKVVVFAFEEQKPSEGPKPPKWLASQKYADPKTTELSVEVTADPKPGQYDFDLKP